MTPEYSTLVLFLLVLVFGYSSSLAFELNCSGIILVDRDEWGSLVSPLNEPFIQRPWRVVIHHSGGDECKTFEDCKNSVLELQKTETELFGLADISTNFLIGGDGRIYEGRGWSKAVHTSDYPESLGVTFIGNYENKLPTDVMLKVCQNLLACGIRKKKLEYDYSLHGHRDMSCTKCPGQSLYDNIRTWSNYDKYHLSTPEC